MNGGLQGGLVFLVSKSKSGEDLDLVLHLLRSLSVVLCCIVLCCVRCNVMCMIIYMSGRCVGASGLVVFIMAGGDLNQLFLQ